MKWKKQSWKPQNGNFKEVMMLVECSHYVILCTFPYPPLYTPKRKSLGRFLFTMFSTSLGYSSFVHTTSEGQKITVTTTIDLFLCFVWGYFYFFFVFFKGNKKGFSRRYCDHNYHHIFLLVMVSSMPLRSNLVHIVLVFSSYQRVPWLSALMLVVLIADGRRRNGEWYYFASPESQKRERKKQTKQNLIRSDSTFISSSTCVSFHSAFFNGILI